LGECLFEVLQNESFVSGFDIADCRQNTISLSHRVTKPICTPDKVKKPPEAFEDFLAQAVTISRGAGSVVCRTVTFHAEQILSRPRRMNDSKVDPKAGHTHLCVDVISSLTYSPGHSRFEGAFKFPTFQRARAEIARFGKMQEAPQHARAADGGFCRYVSCGDPSPTMLE
jgi:hypothetical protein